MPVTVVQRNAGSASTVGYATQAVGGTLTLANSTYIEFDPSVFTAKNAPYTIFTFNALIPSDPAIAVSYLRTDTNNLAECGFVSATFAVIYTAAIGGPGSITVTFQ